MQDQVIDVRRQPEVGRREHRIDAFAGVLDHGIAGIVDEVRVVAGAAEHRVGAGVAVEKIVAGVAGERVGVGVAVALQVGAARQGQVFDIRRQPVMRRRVHRVDAFVGALDDEVAGIVDDVGVVAGAADQHVAARAAVERVVAAETDEDVGGAIAGHDVGHVVADAVEAATPVRVRFSTLAPSV